MCVEAVRSRQVCVSEMQEAQTQVFGREPSPYMFKYNNIMNSGINNPPSSPQPQNQSVPRLPVIGTVGVAHRARRVTGGTRDRPHDPFL